MLRRPAKRTNETQRQKISKSRGRKGSHQHLVFKSNFPPLKLAIFLALIASDFTINKRRSVYGLASVHKKVAPFKRQKVDKRIRAPTQTHLRAKKENCVCSTRNQPHSIPTGLIGALRAWFKMSCRRSLPHFDATLTTRADKKPLRNRAKWTSSARLADCRLKKAI